MDLQRLHFSVKMYVKMKELSPVGGGVHQKILYVDPPYNIAKLLYYYYFDILNVVLFSLLQQIDTNVSCSLKEFKNLFGWLIFDMYEIHFIG